MRVHWKELPMPLRITAGFALLVLGVFGLFLPILQGILFLTAGLMILARDLPWARRWVDRLRRLPHVQRLGAWKRNRRRRASRT